MPSRTGRGFETDEADRVVETLAVAGTTFDGHVLAAWVRMHADDGR